MGVSALITVAALSATAAACQLPSVQQPPSATATVTIDGAVGKTIAIDRRLVERRHQVSAVVDQPSAAGPIRGRFSGVPLVELLASASPTAPSRKNSLIGFAVVARATDGYTIALSYAETDVELSRTPALVAFWCNGRPISPTLVLPGDRDSSRYVHELERLTLLDAAAAASR